MVYRFDRESLSDMKHQKKKNDNYDDYFSYILK